MNKIAKVISFGKTTLTEAMYFTMGAATLFVFIAIAVALTRQY